MRNRKKILFISHDCSYSGAPILLLNLLLLLQKNDRYDISVFIVRGGPLEQKFALHFPVTVLKPTGYGKESNFFLKIKNVVTNRIKLLRLLSEAKKADMVFSNTIVNGLLLRQIHKVQKNIITYVHELNGVLQFYRNGRITENTLNTSKKLAYPSLAVKNNLMANYKVKDEVLSGLNYYFPLEKINEGDEAIRTYANQLKNRFGLNDYFVVGSMGTCCDRKGTDLFVETCALVIKENPKIHFCWIGPFESKQVEKQITEMVRARGLEKHITFTGLLEHHYFNFAAFDLFFLSSREDPYPLVVLEAAAIKIPSLCFEESGGIPEFVSSDAGWVLPGMSVEKAASKILELYQEKELIDIKGRTAQQKFLSLHANEQLVLSQFEKLLL